MVVCVLRLSCLIFDIAPNLFGNQSSVQPILDIIARTGQKRNVELVLSGHDDRSFLSAGHRIGAPHASEPETACASNFDGVRVIRII